MENLGRMTSMSEIAKNQPIYFANEPSDSIYFLKEGRIKLTRNSPDGKEMIIGFINPGEVFGEMAIVDESERTDYAIALDKCMICAISKDDFKQISEQNPELNLRITKLIDLIMPLR